MEGDFLNQKFYKFLFLFHKEQPILNMLLRPVVKFSSELFSRFTLRKSTADVFICTFNSIPLISVCLSSIAAWSTSAVSPPFAARAIRLSSSFLIPPSGFPVSGFLPASAVPCPQWNPGIPESPCLSAPGGFQNSLSGSFHRIFCGWPFPGSLSMASCWCSGCRI